MFCPIGRVECPGQDCVFWVNKKCELYELLKKLLMQLQKDGRTKHAGQN